MCCTDSTCSIETIRRHHFTCNKKIRGALETLEISGSGSTTSHYIGSHIHQLEGPTQCGGQIRRKKFKAEMHGYMLQSLQLIF
uniref:Uncharacterized protein n=1 Tax=Arundo donax TaxID=35708 RepID=A0A0A8XVG2_ARUDO